MSWYNTKYTNANGEYELSAGTLDYEQAKAIEKVCRAVIDGKMKSPEDVQIMVRCRDCKHWKPNGSKAGNSFEDMEFIGGCEFTQYYRRESDFCSWGKRKEGAD